MSAPQVNHVPLIRQALNDPRALCDKLGLLHGPRSFLKQAGRGVIIRCPKHEDRTPSCSVRLAKDGTIAVKCFGCDWGADALGLIAVARGMPMRGAAFRELLIEAAKIGGLWQVVAELERGSERQGGPTPPPMAPPRALEPENERAYPPGAEAFWRALAPVTESAGCAEYLWGRTINPELAEAEDLVRAIPEHGALPSWARYRGQSWRETGHRIIVPMWDAVGAIRSVRGWRVVDGETPKRLPPAGHRSAELIMADSTALAWLRGQWEPKRIVIAEGEPDALVNMLRSNDAGTAVIGIISGSWCKAFADKVPVGCEVIIRTHHDQAGNKYADDIISSLRRKAFMRRVSREATIGAELNLFGAV